MRIAGHIREWVFDLDNTLYPPSCRLFDQVDRRMGRFIAEHLGVDPTEARCIQKDYFLRYGTTLRGLMIHHDVDPEAFLSFVHDIDLSVIPPAPALARAMAALPGRRLVYTNGPRGHAERVLARLGLREVVDGIFDITAAGFVPKPREENFQRFLSHSRITPARAVLVEDMARNLVPAARAGMTTVWLRTGYEWGAVDHDPAAVHHEIDDLAAWLALQASGEGESRSNG